jgi:hypothetical protein
VLLFIEFNRNIFLGTSIADYQSGYGAQKFQGGKSL